MWDEKYSNSQFVYGSSPNDFLRENVHYFVPEGKILCIAEGEGRNAVWLAELGFKVTAVDASEVGLAKGRALAKSKVFLYIGSMLIYSNTIPEQTPGMVSSLYSLICHPICVRVCMPTA